MRSHACALYRHGSRHDIWINSTLTLTTAVPRHVQIKKNTVRAICRALNIPRPDGI